MMGKSAYPSVATALLPSYLGSTPDDKWTSIAVT